MQIFCNELEDCIIQYLLCAGITNIQDIVHYQTEVELLSTIAVRANSTLAPWIKFLVVCSCTGVYFCQGITVRGLYTLIFFYLSLSGVQ